MSDKEEIFNRLVKQYESTIYSVCLMYSDNGAEVDDLVQETLVRIWNGMDRFEGRSDIRSWIWRIAINTCISAQRKRSRGVKTSALESIGVNAQEVATAGTRDHQIGMLYDRIHQLGIFDRAIVLLWLENMTYEEIGLIVGITPQNVSMRLARIREKLMKMSNS